MPLNDKLHQSRTDQKRAAFQHFEPFVHGVAIAVINCRKSSRRGVKTTAVTIRFGMVAVVLIVDDNRQIRDIFAHILHLHGYQTLEATTGFEAIEKTSAMKPNLVLMDISLPDMTGADATRAIKNNSGTGKIPVIGCSAYSDAKNREAALSAGMAEYLVKPVSVDLFTAKIAQLLYLER